jgi:hypothetical protein
VGTLLYLVFRPPSADVLHRQAKAAMDSGNIETQENALEQNGAIGKYLNHYSKLDNEQTRDVRGWKQQIEMARYERLLDTYMQKRNAVIKFEAQGPTQKDAFAAVDAEERGDRESAIKHWQAIKELEGADSSWARVADNHLKEWNAVDEIDKRFQKWHDDIHEERAVPEPTDDRERAAFLAWRMENSRVGDTGKAKSMYKSFRDEMAKEPGLRGRWYLYGAWRNRELKDDENLDKEPLKKRIREELKAVKEQFEGRKIRIRDANWVYRDVIALHRKDTAMSQVVEEAENLLQKLPQERPD